MARCYLPREVQTDRRVLVEQAGRVRLRLRCVVHSQQVAAQAVQQQRDSPVAAAVALLMVRVVLEALLLRELKLCPEAAVLAVLVDLLVLRMLVAGVAAYSLAGTEQLARSQEVAEGRVV